MKGDESLGHGIVTKRFSMRLLERMLQTKLIEKTGLKFFPNVRFHDQSEILKLDLNQ